MAAARWTALFRMRAVEVGARCIRARELLADVAGRLRLPMNVADAQGVRARHDLVRSLLTGASDDLALAASTMEAAETLALYGASANPILPLLSIQHIPDGHRPVRLALSLLQSARSHAEEACLHMERCVRCHLRTADSVLADPTLPGVDGLLGVERSMARRGVKAALNLARASAALAIAAHWLVS